MAPMMSIGKCVLSKTGPDGPDDIQRRIGLVNDDCENMAIQIRNVLKTLGNCKHSVSAEYFHGEPTERLSDAGVEQRNKDMETLRGMRIGNLSKREQRCILLTGEVIHENVEAELGYFVTGSASQACDTPACDTSTKGTKEGLSVFSVELPTSIGQGIGVFDRTEPRCKPPRQTPFTQSDPGAEFDAGSGGLSGHCTCTLHVTRPDDLIQAQPVEGTGFVILDEADKKISVYHRGSLTPADQKLTDNPEDVGQFDGKITVDNVVDVTIEGFITSQVSTICSAMAVLGCSMRTSMVLGMAMGVKHNMEKFYKNIVSSGRYQMVQRHRETGLKPGCDVKKFVSQGVFHKISLDSVTKPGERLDGQSIRDRMGAASCAMIEVYDPESDAYKQYNEDARLMCEALAPLGMTIQAQEEHILSKYFIFDSLLEFFPGEKALRKQYGAHNCFTFFVTYLPDDTTVAGGQKALHDIKTRVDHMNNQFVNVIFADPRVTPAGEVVVLIKLYAYLYK